MLLKWIPIGIDFSGFWVLDLQLLLCDPERVFGYILSSNSLDEGIAKVWSTVTWSAGYISWFVRFATSWIKI